VQVPVRPGHLERDDGLREERGAAQVTRPCRRSAGTGRRATRAAAPSRANRPSASVRARATDDPAGLVVLRLGGAGLVGGGLVGGGGLSVAVQLDRYPGGGLAPGGCPAHASTGSRRTRRREQPRQAQLYDLGQLGPDDGCSVASSLPSRSRAAPSISAALRPVAKIRNTCPNRSSYAWLAATSAAEVAASARAAPACYPAATSRPPAATVRTLAGRSARRCGDGRPGRARRRPTPNRPARGRPPPAPAAGSGYGRPAATARAHRGAAQQASSSRAASSAGSPFQRMSPSTVPPCHSRPWFGSATWSPAYPRVIHSSRLRLPGRPAMPRLWCDGPLNRTCRGNWYELRFVPRPQSMPAC